MDKLNNFEISILERLLNLCPSIRIHIPFLRVMNRENTGVGMYVNFTYVDFDTHIEKLEKLDGSISSNETILIPKLKHGLGYEVDVSNGRIKFIELVTYGESWDGDFSGYSFSP
jgi:hypothetical protein